MVKRHPKNTTAASTFIANEIENQANGAYLKIQTREL